MQYKYLSLLNLQFTKAFYTFLSLKLVIFKVYNNLKPVTNNLKQKIFSLFQFHPVSNGA